MICRPSWQGLDWKRCGVQLSVGASACSAAAKENSPARVPPGVHAMPSINDAPGAVQEPQASQIAYRPLEAVAFAEVRRPCGDLSDKLREDQMGWMNHQDLFQDDALVAQVLEGGGRGAFIACPFRVVWSIATGE